MMIALVIRGPFRLNAHVHESLLVHHLNLFKELGIKVHIYVSAYTSQLPPDIYFSTSEQVLLSNEVSRSQYESMCRRYGFEECIDEDWKFGSKLNTFRQYVTTLRGISLVKHAEYDFIINIRSDSKIAILRDDLDSWLTQDSYNAPHCKGNGGDFINDQISCAQPAIMFNAWNYHSPQKLIELISHSSRGEDPLDLIINSRGLLTSRCLLSNWGHHLIRG